mmetsp:Transcript_13273/g.36670  ORF Transcript_13273/g.36670 Transcript_13273/m.36670 type:complete len:241 (-) Transcript_13273:247-969(-)
MILLMMARSFLGPRRSFGFLPGLLHFPLFRAPQQLLVMRRALAILRVPPLVDEIPLELVLVLVLVELPPINQSIQIARLDAIRGLLRFLLRESPRHEWHAGIASRKHRVSRFAGVIVAAVGDVVHLAHDGQPDVLAFIFGVHVFCQFFVRDHARVVSWFGHPRFVGSIFDDGAGLAEPGIQQRRHANERQDREALPCAHVAVSVGLDFVCGCCGHVVACIAACSYLCCPVVLACIASLYL